MEGGNDCASLYAALGGHVGWLGPPIGDEADAALTIDTISSFRFT